MSLIEIILLAIALGMDCCVVSFSQGLIYQTERTKISLMLAVTMGLFQGLMPYIGYFGADKLSGYLSKYSSMIAFGIFFILGLKFILESFQNKDAKICCIDLKCLISLGIATSIDALIAGASLKFSGTSLIVSTALIGLMSFLMSIAGFWGGNLFKKLPAKYLEILGGLILIFLAFKSL